MIYEDLGNWITMHAIVALDDVSQGGRGSQQRRRQYVTILASETALNFTFDQLIM